MSYEHFGANALREFYQNSHVLLKFGAKMPANASRLRIFA